MVCGDFLSFMTVGIHDQTRGLVVVECYSVRPIANIPLTIILEFPSLCVFDSLLLAFECIHYGKSVYSPSWVVDAGGMVTP